MGFPVGIRRVTRRNSSLETLQPVFCANEPTRNELQRTSCLLDNKDNKQERYHIQPIPCHHIVDPDDTQRPTLMRETHKRPVLSH